MKLLLDTADCTIIERWSWMLDGLTVNPTTLAHASADPSETVARIIKVLNGRTLHLQVTATTPDHVYSQALSISRLAPGTVVKIPCIPLYYPIIQRLCNEHIPVNATLVFSIEQAYAMARFGVHSISLFFGRLEKNGQNALHILSEIRDLLVQGGYQSHLLVASVHTKEHVQIALAAHADALTVPPDLLENLFQDSLAESGFEQFQHDWKSRFATRMFPEI